MCDLANSPLKEIDFTEFGSGLQALLVLKLNQLLEIMVSRLKQADITQTATESVLNREAEAEAVSAKMIISLQNRFNIT